MADGIRGDGLLRADLALEALVQDPSRLDRARRRFSESPPPYTSLSHNSTLSQSPNAPCEEQERRDEWKWQLIRESRESHPYRQFQVESSQETAWLYKANDNRTCRQPVGTDFYELADENVKKRWIVQGIWNDKWDFTNVWQWRWKHEEPLELESQAGADAPPSERSGAKPGRPSRLDELRHVAELRLAREHELEASRPFYQFVYQLSKERQRILEETKPPQPPAPESSNPGAGHAQAQGEPNVPIPPPVDINTTAYERVKNAWVKRGIWNRKWGVLPGMSWKHEQPLEEMLREEMGDDAVAPQARAAEADSHGTGQLPALPRLFRTPSPAGANERQVPGLVAPPQEPGPAIDAAGLAETDRHDTGHETGQSPAQPRLFRTPSPAEANDSQVPGMMALSQEPGPAIDAAGLPNGDANHSPAAPKSGSHHAESIEAPRPALRPNRRRGERKPSVEGGNTTRGPVHASKVSKSRPGPQRRGRRPRTAKAVSEARRLSSGPRIPSASPEAASPMPRRSRRLQEAKHSKAADASGIVAVDAHADGSRPRRRRKGGDAKLARSAKPQGVSKRRKAK